MRSPLVSCVLALLTATAMLSEAAGTARADTYRWPHAGDGAASLAARIPPPAGFNRTPAPAGSFAHWLRNLPMKPPGSPVLLHDGRQKARQDVHVAVVDIDTGKRDLQQCADAVMRLRAEWLYATGRVRDIAFDYTGGGRVAFSRWSEGLRPEANGKRWTKRASPDAGYRSFRAYMDNVFVYAGTYSLSRELAPAAAGDLRIGDVFIMGGFPGHAVLVADMVEHASTGERRFLLLQSYMPAQSVHILKNPTDPQGSPWYPARFPWPLATPEWTFPMGTLKRWPD